MVNAVRRRVVITGMGVVSSGGHSLDRFWEGLLAGRSAVRAITRFDVSAYPSRIAAEITDFDPQRDLDHVAPEWKCRGRIAQYAAVAASRALDDAGLAEPQDGRDRAGVVMAAGMGNYGHREAFEPAAAGAAGVPFDWRALCDGLRRGLLPRALERRTPGSIATLIASEHGFSGPVMAVMTACSGGTQAIGDGLRWIRNGRASIVLAGASDCELYPMGLASFCLLGALSTRNDDPPAASRPFDRHRDGFVIGEGAGAVVLEELNAARRREAHIYAEVAGFGSATDAYRVTDPSPDGIGAVLAMQRALKDAQLDPDNIGYINAHGTSTPANDRAETLAIKTVFGGRAAKIPVSSTKSMIGHATVAAGALEAVVTALTLRDQTVHPTINYETRDPICDLDYVPGRARQVAVEAALSNSFAFGGQAACLVLRRYVEQ